METRKVLFVLAAIVIWSQPVLAGPLDGTIWGKVEDFQTLGTGNPAGKACTGTLGGIWDAESNTSSNVAVASSGSNMYLKLQDNSGTSRRAAGFTQLSSGVNISEDEVGAVFFRVKIDDTIPAAAPVQSYFGLHSSWDADFLKSSVDKTKINAGFVLYRSATSGAIDIRQTDDTTVLKTGLVSEQWYNFWLVADHPNNTFDLYMNAATGPGGAFELPGDADLVGDNIAFTGNPDTLEGFMVLQNPAGPPQVAEAHFDDIYWTVPEPATMLLLGLGGLAALRRRK